MNFVLKVLIGVPSILQDLGLFKISEHISKKRFSTCKITDDSSAAQQLKDPAK